MRLTRNRRLEDTFHNISLVVITHSGWIILIVDLFVALAT